MKRLDAYVIYLIEEFFTSLFFALIFTVNLVYQVQVVGLNPLQLVLVGTLLETTAFLLEVPTGIVADVYSRRLSVIIGTFLLGLGFVIEGSFPFFAAVLLCQIIWGAGATFMSGALEAWVADELGEENAGRAYLRAAQVGQLGALVGISLSIALGSLLINLPIVAGGAGVIGVALFLLVFMPEHGFKPTPRENRNSFQQLAHTFRGGLALVRGRRIVVTILVIAAIFGAFSEGFDRLWTPHLLNNFTLPPLGQFQPIVWFGIINAVSMLLGIVGTEYVRRRVDTNHHVLVARALFVINALIIIGVIVFGLAWTFSLALVALLALKPLRGMSVPLTTAWLNQSLEPGVRATVLSMRNQVDAFGQILGGPVLGLIATAFSLRVEMVVGALVLLPALWLYSRTIRVGAPASALPQVEAGAS